MTPLAVLQDALAVLVMLGILLQTPNATGLGGSIGGGSDGGGGYRRRRGLEATLLRFTVAAIVAFVVISVVGAFIKP